MKVILEFNLPEEQSKFDDCMNVRKYIAIVEQIEQHITTTMAHNETLNKDQLLVYSSIRTKIRDFCNTYGVSI